MTSVIAASSGPTHSLAQRMALLTSAIASSIERSSIEVIGIIERGEDRGVGIAAHGERHGGADHRVVTLAMRRGGEDLSCPGRRILDVLQRAQYVGGDAGLLLAVNAGTVSRRCFRIELLELVDQREDLIAGDERQVRRPERRGRVGQPAIWLTRIRVDAEQHALPRPGEQFEAAIGFPDDEAGFAAIECELLRRPADADQWRFAEDGRRDVPGPRGDRRLGPVEVDADDIVRAECQADPAVPVDVRPFGELHLSRRTFVEGAPFEDGRPLLAGADGDE